MRSSKEEIKSMNIGIGKRKATTMLVVLALLAPYVFALGFVPVEVRAQATGTIVFDISHGQYSSYVHDYEDMDLAGNLTEMGYTVVWANSGLNTSVLTDADGLILGSQYGDDGYTTTEIAAIATWFNAGNKFLWTGSDSDYDGASMNANMSAILEDVGSHVYPEQLSISDSYSNCNASYRVVANGTKAYFGLDVTAGVSAVLMHGPTCLYGSTSGDGLTPVSLVTGSVPNVYPVLFYGASATIGDSDLVPPTSVHPDEGVGAFTAMTIEVAAGTAATGVIVVSGASPYGDYKPMFANEYYDVALQGDLLVKNTINWGMNAALNGAPLIMDFMILYALIGVVGLVAVVLIICIVKKK